MERLSIDGDGLVVYELKHPFRDGTTHVLFEPLNLWLAWPPQLAASARPFDSIPRAVTPGILPYALRASLRLFKIAPGDFVAPHSKHRHHIVTRQQPTSTPEADAACEPKFGWLLCDPPQSINPGALKLWPVRPSTP